MSTQEWQPSTPEQREQIVARWKELEVQGMSELDAVAQAIKEINTRPPVLNSMTRVYPLRVEGLDES